MQTLLSCTFPSQPCSISTDGALPFLPVGIFMSLNGNRYQPSNAWDLNTNFASFGPRNGSIHSTAQENATATFRFKGTLIF